MEPLLEQRLHRPTDEEVAELQAACAANRFTDEVSVALLPHVPGLGLTRAFVCLTRCSHSGCIAPKRASEMIPGRLSHAATTLCLCTVGLLISFPQAAFAWTTPRAIADHRTPSRSGTPSGLAVDDRGRWHLVYGNRVRSGALVKTSIRYLSSASRRPTTMATATSNVDAIDGDPTLVQSRAPGSPDAVTIVSGSRDALLRYSTDVVVANVSKFRVKSP
jgi:hypothetical protein